MRILLVGGPSSGKTTQRKLLAQKVQDKTDSVKILDSEHLPEYFYDKERGDNQQSAIDEFEMTAVFSSAHFDNKNTDPITASTSANNTNNAINTNTNTYAATGRRVTPKFNHRRFDIIVIFFVPESVIIERKLKVRVCRKLSIVRGGDREFIYKRVNLSNKRVNDVLRFAGGPKPPSS